MSESIPNMSSPGRSPEGSGTKNKYATSPTCEIPRAKESRKMLGHRASTSCAATCIGMELCADDTFERSGPFISPSQSTAQNTDKGIPSRPQAMEAETRDSETPPREYQENRHRRDITREHMGRSSKVLTQDIVIKQHSWRYMSFSLQQKQLLPEQLETITAGIVSGFDISDEGTIWRIGQTFRTLEKIYYFEKNVGLYAVSTQFLFYIKAAKPYMFSTKEIVTTLQLLCCMLVHKYFVDNPWNNYSLARLFDFELKKLNEYELYFLEQLGFQFPLRHLFRQ